MQNKVTPEYRAWHHIKDRCCNPNDKRYSDYGGSGIKMCKRWLNRFDLFLKDMGKRPSTKHSIDRFPNNNGNYSPNNCRWATSKQQAFNKRNTIYIEYVGKKYTIPELSKKLKVSREVIRSRFCRNTPPRNAINLRIVSSLIKLGHNTTKKLIEKSGFTQRTIQNALSPLKRKGIVIKNNNKEWELLNEKYLSNKYKNFNQK